MPVVSRTRSLTESILRMLEAASRLLLLVTTAASISRGQEFFARVIASLSACFSSTRESIKPTSLLTGVLSWRSDSLVVVTSSAAGVCLAALVFAGSSCDVGNAAEVVCNVANGIVEMIGVGGKLP